MNQEKRQRLPLDQAEARSTVHTRLQKKKDRLSENSGKFNSKFKFYYDRKVRAIILRTEELAVNRRFISLSATETMVLRTVQEELSGFKKKITASDLREKIILRGCDMETVRNILRALVKKRILNSEKIAIQEYTVEVFKLRGTG
ncbi:hypothetical protein KAT51_00655 [bacterium]|nr:hypothetical protein [bacterium]